MNDAAIILFDQQFGDSPLFKSQQDLVQQFLTLEGGAYFKPPNSPEFLRALNTLKAYVSQLLSDSVTRTVTDDFKTTLKLVLEKKMPQVEAQEISERILDSLAKKNTSFTKSERYISATKNSFKEELANASYISYITAKPMDVDNIVNAGNFSIRKIFVEDLIGFFSAKSDQPKHYRFNFPIDSYCGIFWHGLEKILSQFFTNNFNDSELMTKLLHKRIISKETLLLYYETLENKAQRSLPVFIEDVQQSVFIHNLVCEILTTLNQNRTILTFEIKEPIYSMPLIALNPNQDGKLYYLLENDNKEQSLISASKEAFIIWRIFVWEKLKANKQSKEIKFVPETKETPSPDA